jgi:hypothetical protein
LTVASSLVTTKRIARSGAGNDEMEGGRRLNVPPFSSCHGLTVASFFGGREEDCPL